MGSFVIFSFCRWVRSAFFHSLQSLGSGTFQGLLCRGSHEFSGNRGRLRDWVEWPGTAASDDIRACHDRFITLRKLRFALVDDLYASAVRSSEDCTMSRDFFEGCTKMAKVAGRRRVQPWRSPCNVALDQTMMAIVRPPSIRSTTVPWPGCRRQRREHRRRHSNPRIGKGLERVQTISPTLDSDFSGWVYQTSRRCYPIHIFDHQERDAQLHPVPKPYHRFGLAFLWNDVAARDDQPIGLRDQLVAAGDEGHIVQSDSFPGRSTMTPTQAPPAEDHHQTEQQS